MVVVKVEERVVVVLRDEEMFELDARHVEKVWERRVEDYGITHSS